MVEFNQGVLDNSLVSKAGISNDLLNKTLLDIETAIECIKTIHNEYLDEVTINIKYFQCNSKDLFMEIHNTNDYYFSILEQNILSYVSDIFNLKQKYGSRIDDVASDVRIINERSEVNEFRN